MAGPGGPWGPWGRRGRGAMSVLLALAALLLVPPPATACLHTLRRPPYETYWFGTYPDSRFISFTCFAIRTFRWTVKFFKVTYEGWSLEMEYAKCVSEHFGVNIPTLSPPWARRRRALAAYPYEKYNRNADGRIRALPQNTGPEFPSMSRNYSRDKILAVKNIESGIKMEGWQKKIDTDDDHFLEPIFISNKGQPSQITFVSNQTAFPEELIRILKSYFHILQSLFREIESHLLRAFGSTVLSCTLKYIKGAFWRWIDSAPF